LPLHFPPAKIRNSRQNPKPRSILLLNLNTFSVFFTPSKTLNTERIKKKISSFSFTMKVRTLKLREAHKSINGNNDINPSFCSVLWDQQALHLVTASSSDPSISIHDPLLPSNPPKILRHHRDGVTALALSPNSTCLASGSIDHSVKLFKFPSIALFVCLFIYFNVIIILLPNCQMGSHDSNYPECFFKYCCTSYSSKNSSWILFLYMNENYIS
jgi:WD40 repeat protein